MSTEPHEYSDAWLLARAQEAQSVLAEAAVLSCREAWTSWKAKLDAIADAEGLSPKEDPPPGELDIWRQLWQAGKTPDQAWRSVPYR